MIVTLSLTAEPSFDVMRITPHAARLPYMEAEAASSGEAAFQLHPGQLIIVESHVVQLRARKVSASEIAVFKSRAGQIEAGHVAARKVEAFYDAVLHVESSVDAAGLAAVSSVSEREKTVHLFDGSDAPFLTFIHRHIRFVVFYKIGFR